MIHRYTGLTNKTVALGALLSITPLLHAADVLNLDWESNLDLSPASIAWGALDSVSDGVKSLMRYTSKLIKNDPITTSTVLTVASTLAGAPSGATVAMTYGMSYGLTNGITRGLGDGITQPITTALDNSANTVNTTVENTARTFGRIQQDLTQTFNSGSATLANTFHSGSATLATTFKSGSETFTQAFSSGNATLARTFEEGNASFRKTSDVLTKNITTVTRECLQSSISHTGRTLVQTLAYGSCIGVGAALMYKHLSNYTGKKSAILAGVGGAMVVLPILLAHKTMLVPPVQAQTASVAPSAQNANPARSHARRGSI